MDSSNTNRLVMGLSLLMILLIGGLIYFWNSKNELKEKHELLILEKERQIDKARQQISIFKGKNASLDSLLEVQSRMLDRRSNSIDSLIRRGNYTSSSLAKARRETRRLEGLASAYLVQIDSLMEANKQLVAEKQMLSASFEEEKLKSSKLMDENSNLFSKVEKGKILKAVDIGSKGVRFRNNGKEVDATRADKVEQISTCFTLDENRMADRGAKDIFLRIVAPTGTTLYLESAGSGKFKANGMETLYTKRKTINYSNSAMKTCIDFKVPAYPSGNYTTEVYADGELIGSSTFFLK